MELRAVVLSVVVSTLNLRLSSLLCCKPVRRSLRFRKLSVTPPLGSLKPPANGIWDWFVAWPTVSAEGDGLRVSVTRIIVSLNRKFKDETPRYRTQNMKTEFRHDLAVLESVCKTQLCNLPPLVLKFFHINTLDKNIDYHNKPISKNTYFLMLFHAFYSLLGGPIS